MPSPVAAAPEALHAAIAEVALRANRLHELVELGDIYRKVDDGCRVLAREVKVAQIDLPKVEEIWFTFRNYDLKTLNVFVESTEHIRQRVEAEIATGVGTTVDGWMKQLETLCETLQQDFKDQALAKLAATAAQLQTELISQMVRHKRLIDREVDHLCRLTERLRDLLKTPTEAPPSIIGKDIQK